jgi:hypothetical protein
MDDEESVNTKAMRVLESLTPGGSEFHNSPANCERWISGQKAMAHGIIQRKINRIRQLESEKDYLLRHLGNLADCLCTCGYLLPSQSAIDPSAHTEQCPYRQKAESKE